MSPCIRPARAGTAASCLLALPLLLVACTDDAGPQPTPAAGTPTYREHIAPLFAEHCNSCHVAGGVAPFALTDYATAKKWKGPIKAAVQARTMPPWGVDNSGACGTFREARWLDQKAIDAIVAWAEAGALEGDTKVEVPAPKKLASLATGALEARMPVPYQPIAKGTDDAPDDDYRCFRIDPKLAKDQYVTGWEVVPGNSAVVHHVLVFSVNPLAYPVQAGGKFGSNDEVMKHLDAQDERVGWECFGAAGEGVLVGGLPVAWAPGSDAMQFPAGTGLKLAAGDELVMQVHYSLAAAQGPEAIDQTGVRLQLADQVDKQAWVVLHDPFIFSLFSANPGSLPPGQAEAKYDWTAKLAHMDFWLPPQAGPQLRLHGVMPHMHKRGRQMRLSLEQAGQPAQCAADVPEWDFDWQQFYFFQQPVLVDAKTVFRATCQYDTSGDSKPIPAGYGTENEMCLFGLYFSMP